MAINKIKIVMTIKTILIERRRRKIEQNTFIKHGALTRYQDEWESIEQYETMKVRAYARISDTVGFT